jgi:RND family efflux transporter MFP subunit
MKNSSSLIRSAQPPTGRRRRWTAAGLALVLLGALLASISCRKQGTDLKPADVDYYTCTMHPSVRQQSPKDKCPICGMDLVPVKKKSASGAPAIDSGDHAAHGQPPAAKTEARSDEPPGEFMVPVARQQQIGVTYATITRKPLQRAIRTVGVVAYDKQRHWDYVSRVEGYIQKLEIGSRGDIVEKDQPLLSLYSPELLTTQRELIDLLRLRDEARQSETQAGLESAERMIESAKRRLLLWNLTARQIAELEQSRVAQETLTLYSPFKGVVQSLPVDQGRRVMAGDHLVDLADLSVVWVWAEFYQEELPLLKAGLPVTVTSASYPREQFTGVVDLIDPFINDAKRTGRVRLTLPNPDLKLRPDMYVDIELTLDMGESLTVPVNAVMPTGKHNVVFVDKGEGKLEPRLVELGRKYSDDYALISGLKETERVVASANFLIDAEAKVQGALKSW